MELNLFPTVSTYSRVSALRPNLMSKDVFHNQSLKVTELIAGTLFIQFFPESYCQCFVLHHYWPEDARND